MVKRYNHFGRDDLGYDYDARADQDEEGDWVRYEDYAQIEAALKSIAANTCCDRCQEAALVARSALETGAKPSDG